MFTRYDRACARLPVKRRHLTLSLPFAASAIAFGLLTVTNPALADPGASLTLEEALSRAAEFDPRLRAADASIDAAEAGKKQARVRPNPVLGIEVENFAGSGPLSDFRGSESTFRVSQPIELGGRRNARMSLANSELDAAEIDALIRKLDVFEEVQRAYFDALAADELVDIAKERFDTAQALQQAINQRVAVARDPLMAGARAAASIAEARIVFEQAQRDASIARAALASFWGGDEAFSMPDAPLMLPIATTHPHDPLESANPDVALAEAQRRRAEALLKLERARGYADPVVSLGVRKFEDRDETALVAGVSIPIGVFDRNQGAIARARAERRRADYDVEAMRLKNLRETAALVRRLASAATTISTMEADLIPQAERALSLARDGYSQGAFSYLDVLEAQRALTASREARVQTLRTYYATEAALNRMTARFAGPEEISR